MTELNTRKLLFVDIPSNRVEEGRFELATPYAVFLSLLCTLSGRVADKLEGLPEARLRGEGFTLNDGPWWYRIVQIDDIGGDETPRWLKKGEWRILNNPKNYNDMIEELTNEAAETQWIEIQHVRL